MRKKKRNLGQLNTKIDIIKTEPKRFDVLEKIFDKVMAEFVKNKKEFEKFKAMDKTELLAIRNEKTFENIGDEW
jgi:ABC-type phosphate transport system auxiliary subunit